jgi:hypothetical protein
MDEAGKGAGIASARVITGAWLVLCAATVAGWLLSRGHGGAEHGGVLVAIAAAKIALVMAVFMGLLRAPRGWAIAGSAWILATGVIIFAFYGGVGR